MIVDFEIIKEHIINEVIIPQNKVRRGEIEGMISNWRDKIFAAFELGLIKLSDIDGLLFMLDNEVDYFPKEINMFHVDITAEDCRMIATGVNEGFEVKLFDNLSGKQHIIPFATYCQVEKIAKAMICCHEALTEEEYPEMEKLLEGCPNECRPIP